MTPRELLGALKYLSKNCRALS